MDSSFGTIPKQLVVELSLEIQSFSSDRHYKMNPMERKRLPKITSPRNDNGFPNYQSFELEKSLKTLLKCFQIYKSNPVEIRRKYFIQSFSMGINTMNALAVNASSMLIIAFNTRIVSRKLEPQGVDNFC